MSSIQLTFAAEKSTDKEASASKESPKQRAPFAVLMEGDPQQSPHKKAEQAIKVEKVWRHMPLMKLKALAIKGKDAVAVISAGKETFYLRTKGEMHIKSGDDYWSFEVLKIDNNGVQLQCKSNNKTIYIR